MTRPRLRLLLAATLAAGTLCACAVGGGPSGSVPPSAAPASTPDRTAAPTAALTAAPTLAPSLPPGTKAWPTAFDIELAGTYWTNPPFRIPFAITIDEPGWYSGHLNAEFIDLQRFDGITPHQFPNRMLGFGDPEHIRSGSGPVDVAGLTPDAALDLLADRASLVTTNRAAQALFGLDGARLDLHSATNNNPLFGGADGEFGTGPELDVRLTLLPLNGGLLVVAVLAAPGDLDGAWEQVLPVLASVEIAG